MRRLIGVFLLIGLIGLAPSAALTALPAQAAPAVAPTWWKVDTHRHTAFSGDARTDIGLAAAQARSAGYNAVFFTDHDRAASFQVQGANGNYLSYSDTLSGRFTAKTRGSLTSQAASTVSSPVHSGSASLHLKATSSTSGQSFVYANRGPSLRVGTALIDFWVYPEQIATNSGVDVSVALGGDATVGSNATGYTTSNGVPTNGKSTILVWQLGNARPSSQSGLTQVYATSLSYTPQTWNHYVVNVRTGSVDWTPQSGSTTTSQGYGLNTISTANQPAPYVVLSDVKMEAASTGGTADAYLDDVVLRNTDPRCPAEDFVYRNNLINSGQFNATDFTVFPAREMGQTKHTNQFNFDLTNTSQYSDYYNDTSVPAGYGNDASLCSATNSGSADWTFERYGSDNISRVQSSGYPAQNNHPGVTDSVAAVVSSNAYGADAVEVRTGDDYSNAWDQILQKNHTLIGTYGSDAHTDVKSNTPSDFIDARSLALKDLMHSYFEGRMYLAPSNFTGRIIFNLDSGGRPYPARYPTLISPGQTNVGVHLSITGGIASGSTVRWIYNSGSGAVTTDVPASGSYDATRTIPLTGSFTYVRAEVRNSAGALVANTEPIFFRTVSGMPMGNSIAVDAVTPNSGCACSIAQTKGITSATWGSDGLTLDLTNPSGSVVNLKGTAVEQPSKVMIDGTNVPASTSLSDYNSASGNAWYFDPSTGKLLVQNQQQATNSTINVRFGVADDDPPSVPRNLTASAVNSTQVKLTWSDSTDTDASPVAGYHVFRNGSQIADVTSGTSYTDGSVSPGTSYTYTVSAYDTAGLESSPSAALSVTTLTNSATFTAGGDAYVVAGDSVNHGTATSLRTDTSPDTKSYLRFTFAGLGGSSVTSAKLKVYANSSLNAGFSVRSTTSGWTETGILAANAPPVGTSGINSGAVTAGGYVTVDVTSLVTQTTGDVNLALVGLSTTNLTLGSRESANKPQLQVTTAN
jgi:hypothetical protein